MSEPRRFYYPSFAALPSVEEILRDLDRQHHVVLQFPAKYEARKQTLIRYLRIRLPENCSIFNSGNSSERTWVTVKQVISRPELQAIESVLIDAARLFRRTAHLLARELAAFNGVPAEELWEHRERLRPFPGDWTIAHHGGHQCFKNRKTGQTVEVSMWFGDEFGVLDPEFFCTFLRTTPGLDCPVEIIDHYHDAARALDYLKGRGLLTGIDGIFDSRGVFAPDPQ